MTTTALDPDDCAAAYHALRERVAALVTAADARALDARAPATPEWRVRDVLAHMTGVNTDIVNGALDGVATDAWTATQVDTRRAWPVDRLLVEWEETGSEVEANAAFLGPAVGQWLYDACTHEHDIRQALGTPGARDSDAVALAYVWGGDRLGEALDKKGVGSLAVETEAGARSIGTGEPRVGLRLDRFELVRAMTGRRSVAQMRAYGWDGAPIPEHLTLLIFTPRGDDFVE